MEKLQVAVQKGVAEKKSKVRCVRYAECERNHAVNNGGFVVDGCKEFVASDENGDSALKCSCCGCHRNFHRIVEDTDQESFGVGEQKEKKRRKKKSEVWDDFKESRDKDGIEWAICKHCNGQFDGSSEKGTTHLRNHLKSKKCLAKRNGGDGNEDISTQTSDLATPTLAVMEKKSPLIDLIKQMFNEYGEFIEHWDSSVFNSRKDEILQVYQEEKEKQDKFLSNLSCRLSLQISPDMFLMVHYIDDNWERQSKIISLTPSENHIEETKKLCLDLKIDRNICFIQYYDFLIDDDDEEIIESWFSQRGSLPFVGVRLDFLHIIEWVQLFIYGWKMNEIDGLRECVDYGYKTPFNNLKLQIAITRAKTMGKKVILNDDPFEYLELNDGPCFDELFEYLEFAVGLKEAFSELEKIDPDFTSINLTNQKWNEATTTLEHFKAMEKFLNKYCKALEDFVNNFFWDVTIIPDILKLIRFHNSEDCQICTNASYNNLFDKIQDYLVIIILDPRFKMDAIQHWCKEIYGSDADGYFEKTLKHFRNVYNEYAKESSSEDDKMMDAIGRPCTTSTKSELDLYLHHLKVPAVEEFDILAWWRGNAPFYPTLSRMARDYLALSININIHLPRGIFYIKYCSEIDEGIKSALIYLMGLWYFQS